MYWMGSHNPAKQKVSGKTFLRKDLPPEEYGTGCAYPSSGYKHASARRSAKLARPITGTMTTQTALEFRRQAERDFARFGRLAMQKWLQENGKSRIA